MKKYFLYILLFIVITNVRAQIHMIEKHDAKKIELRWVVENPTDFKFAYQNGFEIKKIKSKNKPSLEEWKKIDGLKIKGIDFVGENEKLLESEESYQLLYYFLNNQNFSPDKEKMILSFIYLKMDQDKNFSKNCATYIMDSITTNDTKIFYSISIPGTKVKSKIIEIDLNTETKYSPLRNFIVKQDKKQIKATWPYKEWIKDYSGFDLERTDENDVFQKLNTTRITPFESKDEKEKESTFFYDTTAKKNITYRYRLIAFDHFGDKVQISDLIEIKMHEVFESELILDTIFEIQNEIVQIKWHTRQIELLEKIDLQYSEKYEGPYKNIQSLKVDDKVIETKLINRTNYFRIHAFTNLGEDVYSWPELYLVPDRKAPDEVKDFKGKIDSLGIVHLTWQSNTEKDLMGYRIYRCNALHEEMVEVTRNFAVGNKFQDSISLQTLTEEIFYEIAAVDSNYNNGKCSIPLKLLKPDIIAPVSSVFIGYDITSKGNELKWLLSTSADFEKVILEKAAENNLFYKIYETDSILIFMDSINIWDKYCKYRLVTIDDANNKSYSDTLNLLNPNMKLKTKSEMTSVVDRKNKSITLNWTNPETQVYAYTLYKAKGNEPYRSFKTFTEKKTEYVDKDLYISNQYRYKLVVKHQSGRVEEVGECVVEY